MISHFIIIIFGAIGMWLIADERIGIKRLGAIISLVAVPFELISTASTEQWGVFVLCLVCACSFIKILLPMWQEYKTKKN